MAPAGSSAALAATAEKRRLRLALQDYRDQQKKMSSNMARSLARSSAAIKSEDKESDKITSSAHSSTSSFTSPASNAVNLSHEADKKIVNASKEDEKSAPAPITTKSTTALPSAVGADRGLLLLLGTSLAVLFVSVAMMLWGPSSSLPRH